MVSLLASVAFADEPPRVGRATTVLVADPIATHAPAPLEDRTHQVLLLIASDEFPRSSTLDGEPLGCPVPCELPMAAGEHELVLTFRKGRTATWLLTVGAEPVQVATLTGSSRVSGRDR